MINPCTLPYKLIRKLKSKPTSASALARDIPAQREDNSSGSSSSKGKNKMTRNEIPPPSYTEAAANGGVPSTDLNLTLEASGNSLLVTVTPPSNVSTDGEKKKGDKRAPLDLVTVIDVSGSMSASAPAYTEQGKPKEDTGLSVLDVVKHAMKTIIATMEDEDRLAIVAFDDSAEIVSNFVSTDKSGKNKLNEAVEGMYPKNMTNLWDGLKTGMNLLDDLQNGGASGSAGEDISPAAGNKGNRLSSVFILTDGQPNVEPPRGHIPMLEQYLESHPNARFNISTFGFGYNLDSALLSDIAKVGAGGFGFIPDAGMVGTVFVHAVSNLYATYATRCFLNIEIPEESGAKLKQPKGGFHTVNASWGSRVDFGDLQYGQSRDLVFEFDGCDNIPEGTTVSTVVKPWFSAEATNATATVGASAGLSQSHKYNQYRLDLVDGIYTLCGQFSSSSRHSYHRPDNANAKLIEAKESFTSLGNKIKEELNSYEPAEALATDILGEVVLAVSDGANWEKWGRHYFPSLARSHQRQQCGNFKDAGLQMYGKYSTLFIKSRDLVDAAFDKLPPPKPSNKRQGVSYASVNMRSYNMSCGPCFTGNNLVTLADGSKSRVDKIVRQTSVATPTGPKTVRAVLKTQVSGGLAVVCKIGDLTITPWHPIFYNNQWCFPASISEPEFVDCDFVYSFLLEQDPNADSHAMDISGIRAVTLGHGVTAENDIRAHPFLGAYDRVVIEMEKLDGYNSADGLAMCYGLHRVDGGLITSFVGKPETPLVGPQEKRGNFAIESTA